jgi:RHS repeat-associated protein
MRRLWLKTGRLFVGFVLLLGMANEPRAQSLTSVTLLASTSPVAAEPAVTNVSVTGSNFPAGTIPAANVTISIRKIGITGVTTVKATAVTTVAGTTRRVSFTVPASISVLTPTNYSVTVTGTTSAGAAFSSTNSAAMTVNPAAAVSVISPPAGQPGQTLSVAVTGVFSNFLQGSTIAGFGAGITTNSVTVTSATAATVSITVAGNATGGPRNVTMTTGTEVATLVSGFAVQIPALLSVNPSTGQQGQTFLFSVTGNFTHFAQGTTQVNLGSGFTVSNVTVTSPTTLTAQAAIDPAATVGPTTLTVTTGGEVVSAANIFNVQAAQPALLSLSPAGGAQGQQNLPVAIAGINTHFAQGTSTASFGSGVTVTGLTIANATSATATINISATANPGSQTVTVTTGSEVASLVNGFAITASQPIIVTLNPGGSSQGATNLPVQITGLNTHFAQGSSTASFGAGITVNSLAVSSPTAATANIDINQTATVGPRTVTVTTGTEVASFTNGFSVAAGVPGITVINPGSAAQGISNLSVSVTAQFTNFVQGTTTANFGAGVTVASLTINSATTATAVVSVSPAATLGARNVTFTTGAQAVTAVSGFTITAGSPSLLSLNPNTALQGQQNVSVTITGQLTHFAQGTTTAAFGAGVTVASLTINSITSAMAILNIASAATVGLQTVTMTTGSEIAALTNGFGILPGTPVLTQLSPVGAQQGQQNLPVMITGQFTHFTQGVSQVSFGSGITVGAVGVASATALTAFVNVTPTAPVGTSGVTVTTGNETASLPLGFTVQPVTSGPVSENPSSAFQGQSLPVTITGQGTHFVAGGTVARFGPGISVGSALPGDFGPVTVTSPTTATAQISIVSNALPGSRTVTVQTSSETDVGANGFVILGVPYISAVSPTGANQGASGAVLINGTYTNFASGASQVSFGAGVTVTGVTVTSSSSLSAAIAISPAASPGPRTVSVQTVAEVVSLANGFTVFGPITGPGPNPTITSLAEGAVITAPTQIVGTVTSTNLAYWTLEYQAPQSSTFTQFATGSSSAVTGTLDPSLLLNGSAIVRLTGVDTSGQMTATSLDVVIARNLKVGNFTVSFNDLTVANVGLPVQIVRTNDSRRQASGDFGFGWTLDLKTATITTNIPIGDGWAGTVSGGFFPTYCVVESVQHVITVTFSDGITYQFSPSLSGQCQQLVPPSDVTVGFTPLTSSGTTPPNAGLALAASGPYTLFGSWPGPMTIFDFNNLSSLDPDPFMATLPDGRLLQISKQNGLQKETDLNGNTLTITPAGIISSSGKSLAFTRDSQGRIAQIVDPAGNTLKYAYNASGDLTAFTNQNSETSAYTYNATHGLLTIVDPAGGQPIRNDYDASGRLTSHTDAYGNVINYDNNLSGQQEIVTDRNGNITVNQYDSAGNIVQITDALGGITKRTFDNNGNVLTETNALGHIRSYTYDPNNNKLSDTDPLGNSTTYTYNSLNQVLTISDALHHTTTNVYDGGGNLLSTVDASGNKTSYTYNNTGLRTSMTDPLGFQITYAYDSAGNLVQQTDPLGHITAYTYDANGNRLTQTQNRTTASGVVSLVTSYKYDALNRLIQTTYPDSSTTQTQFGANGKQSVTIDQLGRQTKYSYDLMGRLTQTTYADGTYESFAYDANGNRVSGTDRANRATLYAFDPLNRLVKTTFPDTAITTTTYDAIGEVIALTDALGHTTQYAFDAAGHRTQIVDALSEVTAFQYDAAGNQTQMTDANGHSTTYQYDQRNRRTRVTYSDGTFDQTAYDALGRAIRRTDQAGLTTQYAYDGLGRLVQVTDALSQNTKYAYDEVGNRVSQTDANRHKTVFLYDNLGRRAGRTLPLGMSESMTYDGAGNLATKTDFNSKTTTYAYDLSNRLVSKTPDPSFKAPTVQFTYTSAGQRQSMADESGTANYTYDLRDRLLTKATPEGTLTYSYDLQGNLTSLVSSNTGGASVSYAYDALNRLAAAHDNYGGTTSYSYDKVGNLGGYTYPNGVQSAFVYDALNRLTSLVVSKGSALTSYAYTLGPSGSRIQVGELGGRQINYGYDNLYRLTTEVISASAANNGTIGYVYDSVGNRLSRSSTVPAVSSASSVYDANDRLASDSYDPEGNTTASGSASYKYDFENHLIGSTANNFSALYDGDGNRVSRTASGVTTTFLVDDRNLTGHAQVIEEQSGGAVQRVYTYGLNRISQSQASGTSFYGNDGHGSVRLLTDTTGAVTDRYDYDAFGNIINHAGTTPNLYLYSAEQNDPNIGLYYLRARYMSQSTGRFWTTDTNEGRPSSPISQNKYTYAGNEPVVRVDPSGNQFDLLSLSLEVVLFDVLSSIATANPSSAFRKAGLTGPAFTILSGAFLGGYNVNSYIGDGDTWKVPLSAPGIAGAETVFLSGKPTARFKIQMAAPYTGAQTVSVNQTITPVNANGALLKALTDYLADFEQPAASNGQTIGEPALADGDTTVWGFPLYTANKVTFADVLGGFDTGSIGDIQFQTTFSTSDPHSKYSRSAVTWTLHVNFASANNQQLSVTQVSQSAQ